MQSYVKLVQIDNFHVYKRQHLEAVIERSISNGKNNCKKDKIPRYKPNKEYEKTI